jgi:membrane-anchored protein YejM (alkaline phosphatase superfamily)
LQELKAEGAFDNTLVMILGDHGNLFDHFRKTTLGRIEANMPLLGIILPKSLKHFRKNLESNSEVLTSWYDVHEMLLDVATGNLDHHTEKVIKVYLFEWKISIE